MTISTEAFGSDDLGVVKDYGKSVKFDSVEVREFAQDPSEFNHVARDRKCTLREVIFRTICYGIYLTVIFPFFFAFCLAYYPRSSVLPVHIPIVGTYFMPLKKFIKAPKKIEVHLFDVQVDSTDDNPLGIFGDMTKLLPIPGLTAAKPPSFAPLQCPIHMKEVSLLTLDNAKIKGWLIRSELHKIITPDPPEDKVDKKKKHKKKSKKGKEEEEVVEAKAEVKAEAKDNPFIPGEEAKHEFLAKLTQQTRDRVQKNSKNVIVLVHGYSHGSFIAHNKEEKETMFNKIALPLLKNGYQVMLVDLRFHGASSSIAPVSSGYFEELDVMAAIDYLEMVEGFDVEKSIGIYGFSLGATASLMSFGKNAIDIRGKNTEVAKLLSTPLSIEDSINKEDTKKDLKNDDDRNLRGLTQAAKEYVDEKDKDEKVLKEVKEDGDKKEDSDKNGDKHGDKMDDKDEKNEINIVLEDKSDPVKGLFEKLGRSTKRSRNDLREVWELEHATKDTKAGADFLHASVSPTKNSNVETLKYLLNGDTIEYKPAIYDHQLDTNYYEHPNIESYETYTHQELLNKKAIGYLKNQHITNGNAHQEGFMAWLKMPRVLAIESPEISHLTLNQDYFSTYSPITLPEKWSDLVLYYWGYLTGVDFFEPWSSMHLRDPKMSAESIYQIPVQGHIPNSDDIDKIPGDVERTKYAAYVSDKFARGRHLMQISPTTYGDTVYSHQGPVLKEVMEAALKKADTTVNSYIYESHNGNSYEAYLRMNEYARKVVKFFDEGLM